MVTESSGGPDTLFMELYENVRSKRKPEYFSVTSHLRPVCLIFNLHNCKLNKLYHYLHDTIIHFSSADN